MKQIQGVESVWLIPDSHWKEGGNSLVFLGKKDGGGQEHVAIKVFKQNLKGMNREKRFLKEIEILKKIKGTPGCISYLDHGISDDFSFFVADLCTGGDLHDRYIKGSLNESVESTLRLFLALLENVKKLHLQQIAIRDIKPQNIFLDAELAPIIGDFGLCLPANTPSEERISNTPVGSNGYRAPEWTDVYPEPDHTPGDIWSLGRTLWAIFARRHPPQLELLESKDYHLKNFADAKYCSLLQGLVNVSQAPRPESRIAIDEFIGHVKETIQVLHTDNEEKSSSASIAASLAGINLKLEGSALRAQAKLEIDQQNLRVEQIKEARAIFDEKLKQIEKEISAHIDPKFGKVHKINQNGGSPYPYDISSNIESSWQGITFNPTHHLPRVLYGFWFGFDHKRELYYFVDYLEVKNQKTMNPPVFVRSISHFASQKVHQLESIVRSRFIPALEAEYTN